jgi:predicted Fe-Mo cluster-binding NifX family protein
MKVAIPIWEDRVSPVLDTASRLLVIDVENRKEASRSETYLEGLDLFRRCFRIQNLGVDILICGAISRPYFRELAATGIRVISGISGNPEDVLKAYLKGTLSHSRFAMPGCRGNSFRRRMMHSPLEEHNDRGRKGGREKSP